MPNKKFLEEYPLYRRFDFEIEKIWSTNYTTGGTRISQLPKPAINLECPICKSIQTFNMVNEYFDDSDLKKKYNSPAFVSFQLNYFCSCCKAFHYEFFVDFGVTRKIDKDKNEIWTNGWVRKIGQKPEWSIEIDSQVQKFINEENILLFKKGLICESQSYGIGAYSYYRRIVESIIDDLLKEIEELIPDGDEKKEYLIAFEKTKKEIIAANKISLVKDLIPKVLLIDDVNPLAVLYSAVSDGLHNRTDEECLNIAETIRECLSFLIIQIYSSKNSKKQFTDRIKTLLKKKTK
ncbi:MAG: hypothetical protein Q8P53_03940 [Candidatus Shapirobacteria bacterium]|nr:hypothetical protein [Candidatus Shapirobacteria bacterium]